VGLQRIVRVRFLAFLGSVVLGLVAGVKVFAEEIGRTVILLGHSCIWLARPPFRYHEFVKQIDFVGSQSIFLIVITGLFTGMVICLQGYIGMHRFGAESLVGATAALSLARELGPVLSALMLIARVGSAMTAELGSMRNTQQIDALSSMAVDPIQYLVVPRMVAATLSSPALALVFGFSGMVGAYVVGIWYLGMDAGLFMDGVRYYLTIDDVGHGLVKSVVFGLLISLVACYQGFYVTGGARGVGIATTKGVVASSVLVLVSDYIMTSLMFGGR